MRRKRTLSLFCALVPLIPALALPGVASTGILTAPNLDNPLRDAADAFDNGEYNETVELLTRHLRSNPRDVDALVRRGVAYTKLKKPELALADFDRAYAISPDSPRVALVRGACLYEQTEYERAIPDLIAACAGYPTDNFPPVLLAFCYYHMGEHQKSLDMARKAVKLGYALDENFVLMMVSNLAELKDFVEAEKLLAQICDKPGATADAWIARGNCAGYQEKYVEAEKYYLKALELEPQNPDAHYHLAICKLAANKNEVGIKQLSEAVAAAPHATKLRLFKADLLFKLRRYEEALEDYEALDKILPNDYRVLKGKAATLALLGRYEGVLAVAEAACKLQPQDPTSQLLRATCLTASGRNAEAEGAFEAAIKYGGGENQYRLARARFFTGQKRYREAVADYDAMSEDGMNDEIVAERLLPLLEIGATDRALKDVDTLTAHNYDSPWIYLLRGSMTASHGNLSGSLVDLEKFAAKNPDSQAIQPLLAKIYFSSSRYADALKAADLALAKNPGDSDMRRIRAASNFCLHNYRQVVIDANAVLDKEPDRLMYELAGFSQIGLGDTRAGALCFQKIVEKFPEHYSGYNHLGLYLADAGHKDQAYAMLCKAIERSPNRATLYLERGQIALDLTANAADVQREMALQDYARALELQPELAEVYDKRSGLYFKDGKYDLARRDLDMLLKLKPTSFKTYLRLAAVDEKLFGEVAARADRETLVNLPLSAEKDLLERAAFYKENGLDHLALKDTIFALNNNPASVRALLQACEIFDRQYDSSDEAYLLETRNDRKNLAIARQIELCLSRYYENTGQYAKAFKYLDLAKYGGAQARKDWQNAVKNKKIAADDLSRILPCARGTGANAAIALVADTRRAAIFYHQHDYKAARAQLILNIKNYPNAAENHLWLGRLLKAEGAYEKAVEEFDKAIALDPHLIGAYKSKALALSSMNKPRGALTTINGAIEQDRASGAIFKPMSDVRADLLELKAVYQMDCGLYPEAIQSYGAAIARDPESPSLYLDRGSAYLRLENYREALADCEKSLTLDPDRVEALVNLAACHRGLGQYARAIECYRRALQENPDWYDTYGSLAACEALQGDYKAAVRDYTRALKYNPRSQSLYIGRGSARGAMGDYQGLLDDTTTAHKLGKPTAVSLKNLSIAHSKLGQDGQAESRLQQALKDDPSSTANYLSLADLLAGRVDAAPDRLEQALAAVDQAIAINQNLARARLKHVEILRRLGKLEASLTEADAYLATTPGDNRMKLERAASLLEMGRAADALDAIAAIDPAALERERKQAGVRENRDPDPSDDINLHTIKGRALMTLARDREAIGAFDRALELNIKDKAARLGRGSLNLKLHNYKEALVDLDHLLDTRLTGAEQWRYLSMRALCYKGLGNTARASRDELAARRIQPPGAVLPVTDSAAKAQ